MKKFVKRAVSFCMCGAVFFTSNVSTLNVFANTLDETTSSVDTSDASLEQVPEALTGSPVVFEEEPVKLDLTLGEEKDVKEYFDQNTDFKEIVWEIPEEVRPVNEKDIIVTGDKNKLKAEKVGKTEIEATAKDDKENVLKTFEVTVTEDVSSSADTSSEPAEDVDIPDEDLPADEPDETSQANAPPVVSSTTSEDSTSSTSSVSEALLFDENGVPLDRAAIAKVLKGFPLVNPAASGLKGAYTGGTASLCEYDFEGHGYSFPSNFPVPYFAGHSTSKWVALALYRSDTDMQHAYCIEFGRDAYYGTKYSAQETWSSLSQDQRQTLGLILSYGFTPDVKLSDYFDGTMEGNLYALIATQCAIWMTVSGNWNSPYREQIINTFAANNGGQYGATKAYFDQLAYKVNSFKTVPSYASISSTSAPTYELTYNSATGKYETTLTDTAGASGFTFTMAGVDFVQDGNKLKISTSNPNITGVASASKSVPASDAMIALYWTGNNSQSLATAKNGQPDPIQAYFKLQVTGGNIDLIKTSEDGIVEGIQFTIKNVDTGAVQVATTDATGHFNVAVSAGNYEVAEIYVPDQYVVPAPVSVTVKAGETAKVTFDNVLRPGKAQIIKESEDGVIEGVKFNISGTATNGTKVNETVVTGADGTILKEIPVGTYTVTELEIPDRYVKPSSKTITVKAGETATVKFHNYLDDSRTQIIKTSDDGVVAGVKFQITGENFDKTFTTDEDGVITTYLTVGTYTIKELQVADRYVSPPAQTVTIESRKTAVVKFHNTLKPGKAKIVKTSDDGIVEGLKFSITGTATNGTEVNETVTTDKNGTILKEVPAGTYTVKEVQTPSRYTAPAAQTITVKPNETATVSFHNVLNGGKAKIVKTSDDGIVKGIKFSIVGTATNGTKVNETVTTDENGTILKDVPAGTYTVSELEVDSRYVSPKSQTVTVQPNETATVNFHNSLKSGKAKIVKTSDDGIVEGLKFSITGTATNGTEVNETVTTDENGTILKEVPAGTYTVKEVQTPSRYTAPAAQTVTVKPNETATVSFHNVLNGGKAKIVKTSDDGIVKGIKFSIVGTATNGTKVNETVTTDENGTILKDVPAGTYTVSELEVASRYVSPKPQTITVKPNETATVKFHNALNNGETKIIKTSDDGIVENVKFHVTGTATNGTKVDETYTTDKNGVISTDLPVGSYTVTELEVADRYVTPAAQTVTVKPNETASVTFHNSLKGGKAKIIKTSDDGVVANIKFKIFGTATNGQKIDITVTTGADGTIVKDIAAGTYTVSELEVADRYVSPAAQTITVKPNETASVTFNNVLQNGKAKIIKQSDDGVVANIKFQITGTATNGSKVDTTVTTGSDGTIVKDIAAGTYTVTELEIADRYVAPAPQTITVKSNETASVTFKNVLKNGKAKIVKTSDDGIVKDVKFNITGTAINGQKIDITVTTGADGTIVKDIAAGTYTVTELEVADRYVSPAAQTISVKPNETASVTFHNVLQNGKAKIIKQSDDGVVANIKFQITGTATNGSKVDTTVTTGSDGTITKEIAAGTYTVSELEIADRYVAPAPQTITVKPNETASVTFKNVLKNGKAKIVKTSDDDVVKDVKFNITGTAINGTEVNETVVTGEDGTILKEVPAGTFTVTELEVNNRYVSPKSQTITVNPDETAEVSFHNTLKNGKAKIIKTSDDGIVKGVKFNIAGTATNGAKVDVTVVTGEDGTILKEVPAGTFTVTELEVADRYVTPKAQTVTVKPNETAEVSFHNALQSGKAKIVKTSDDNIIKDVKFNIAGTAINGTKVNETVVTGEDGTILKEVPAGTFTVTELEVAGRYVTPAAQQITVMPNETATVSFHNALRSGKARIVKTSDDGIIEGVKFSVVGTAINGTEVNETVVTGEDGTILKEVPAGTFTVTELEVAGRYVSPKPQTVTVNPNEVATVKFHNALKSGKAKIVKTSDDSIIENVKFNIAGTAINGTKVDETVVTGEDGTILKEIPAGTFTVTELEVAGRYVTPKAQTVTVKPNETATVKFHNALKDGKAKIIKTSDDGLVKDVKFSIVGTAINGTKVNETVVTGEDGTILKTVPAGTYAVTELEVNNRYVTPKAQTITVKPDETAEVSFHNTLKPGTAKIIKVSEDGIIEGVKFSIVGTSITGKEINETVVTNDKGEIAKSIEEGHYTITELAVADRYVTPAPQTVDVKATKTATVTFNNKLKYFDITLTKQDAETGAAAQGDSTLDGAVYGLYKGDTLIERLTIKNGTASSGQHVCGDDYYIQEITPPTGYQLDNTKYPIDAKASNFTGAKNPLNLTVKDNVIKGKISIQKLKESIIPDGNGTDLEGIPEEGAVFQLWLKSAGSYDKAKDSEKDTLTTDATGLATSKLLPYGTYTVHQVSGADGRELVADFDVLIGENNKVYTYSLTNKIKTSAIKIIKKDAETKEVIPLAGTAFKVKSMATGNWITVNGIDTFYTDNGGQLLLPVELPYGKYELHEVTAPQGYVLADKIPFTVDGKDKTITLTCYDTAQKGQIHILKTGENFSSVYVEYTMESGKIYQPVYEIGTQAGAEYDIIAAEDIVTADGTIRAKKGDVVDHLTTTSSGAISKELYLGKYEVKETKAPEGFVLNGKSQIVTLSYAGQEVEAILDSVTFYNERQKVEVSLLKQLEQDELYSIGMNEEYKNVRFGLYAAEEIKAADGEVIYENGLIEVQTIDEDGKLQFKTDLPFGKYYVKEIATDEHYVISNTKYPFEFKYGDQKDAIIQIAINDGEAIENELKRGKIDGLKVGESEDSLEGAVIGLFAPDTAEFTEENAYLVDTSDEDGHFEFADVPYGDYIVREITPPTGYILSDTSYPVTVTEDGETIEVTVTNTLIRGNVHTTKVDEEYPDNKLTGAVFDIYLDVDGDGKYDADIDEKVATMTESEDEAGEYYANDLTYGQYLLHEEEAPYGFIVDEGYYPFEIVEDGVTVTVENEAGVGFTNKPGKGGLELTKQDVSTGAPLPDAGFRIWDSDGNIVAEGRTDENGVAKFDELRIGDYFYQEFDAPKGYEIDESKFPFSIKEDGEIVKCVMTNRPKVGEVDYSKPDQPISVKTGDTNQVFPLLCVALSSLGMLILAVRLYKMKSKKEDDK